MEIITADWETYYDKDYSLSKISTESYVRDPKFQAIMLGLRMPDGSKRVITGTHAEIKYQLDAIEWGRHAVLCHNTLFDAPIFTWVFGVKPAVWLDTLGMARAMHGNKGNSLKALSEFYGLEEKGTYVANMMGRRRESLTAAEFDYYAEYCLRDVDNTYDLFQIMSEGWYNPETVDKRDNFPLNELKLIDATIRMFSEPVLKLNLPKLEQHLTTVKARKEELLAKCAADKESLMSNPKFADVLRSLGVDPPTKISPTTGKEAYAFSKTDQGMLELKEHPNPDVQAVVGARLGVKSTLEETRTERFIGIAGRGLLPVPLRYSAAISHRWGGTDGINMQNLPSRGDNAGAIKECIEPPDGYVIVASDSSNIEARGLGWLAEQDDLVTDFANGVDVYCKLASIIYRRKITKADKPERFLGKTVVLGCGYQTGAEKLRATIKVGQIPMDLPIEECKDIVNTYRSTYSRIPLLWKAGERALKAIHDNETMWLGREGALLVEGRRGIKLPSGLYIKYPQLHSKETEKGRGWMYKSDYGMTHIYGGKVIENVTQALARIIIGQQLLRIQKRYKVVMTVHDSIVCVARESEKEEAAAYITECMRWVPKWAAGWPLDCETEIGPNYGDTNLWTPS